MSQVSAHHLLSTVSDTANLHYLLYLPEQYQASGTERWPLVLFLHGSGERGNNLELLYIHGPLKHIRQGQQYPFVLAAPQCPEGQWWDRNQLWALLQDLRSRLAIDPDRVYITGLSMGGYATWEMACYYAQHIAAIAPVCGGGVPILAGRSLSKTAVWAFHGAQDKVVPLHHSTEMVDKVNEMGGKARMTIYPDAGHDAWSATYQNPELYQWLLSAQRPH